MVQSDALGITHVVFCLTPPKVHLCDTRFLRTKRLCNLAATPLQSRFRPHHHSRGQPYSRHCPTHSSPRRYPTPSVTPSLPRRMPMIFRTAHAALAFLALFSVASSLASPVTWAQRARRAPQHPCNCATSHLYSRPLAPHSALGGGLCSRTRRPQAAALLPSLPPEAP